MEKNVVMIALFAALIAVLGLLPSITLAFGVPISAQALGIMLCGSILGSKRAFLAVILFLILIMMGLPLLSGGRGGLGVFFAPTTGFLISWPFAAYTIGLIIEKWPNKNLTAAVVTASFIGGIIIPYTLGIAGLAINLQKNIVEASILVTAFIPGDILKIIIATSLTKSLAKARPNYMVSRKK